MRQNEERAPPGTLLSWSQHGEDTYQDSRPKTDRTKRVFASSSCLCFTVAPGMGNRPDFQAARVWLCQEASSVCPTAQTQRTYRADSEICGLCLRQAAVSTEGLEAHPELWTLTAAEVTGKAERKGGRTQKYPGSSSLRNTQIDLDLRSNPLPNLQDGAWPQSLQRSACSVPTPRSPLTLTRLLCVQPSRLSPSRCPPNKQRHSPLGRNQSIFLPQATLLSIK